MNLKDSRLSARSFFRRIGLTLTVLPALALSAMVQAQDGYSVSGTAYQINTTKVVYRELFTPLDANREITVNYAKPDGSVFATKTLRFTGEPTQPEFEFKDQRTNERRAARFDAGRVFLTFDQQGLKQEKEVLETANLVIDAGRDALIQQHWDALLEGKRIRFQQAWPERLEVAGLQIREIKADRSPLNNASNPTTWRYFVVEPSHKVSAIFATPVHLAYEPDGRYLMRSQGRAPVANDRGRNQDVRVEYEYW